MGIILLHTSTKLYSYHFTCHSTLCNLLLKKKSTLQNCLHTARIITRTVPSNFCCCYGAHVMRFQSRLRSLYNLCLYSIRQKSDFLFLTSPAMASPRRELSYGSVQIYDKEVLGIGSYGKVCKAKCGQLPCAAKLLHDTLFQDNDPGTRNLVTKFLQECQFLSTIKHPSIVQYLGTATDPQSRRTVLLMELMDESLTRFLERLTGPLPYHSQLNICHDVALALAYLHSNGIIHRDLSSNNVLLIGEGSRAKVTDFGMSKLMDMNPRMTPLTQVPGTPAYMSPEALISPPHYSSKLDCFSHGVLALQIITRNFPNPGDASRYVADPRYPTGRVLVQFPEAERRKKDIDLIEPSHPLRLIALHCLKDMDTERPSADELCGRLASLKREPRYTHSVEQTRGDIQRLQEELGTERATLERERAEHQRQLREKEEIIRKFQEKAQDKSPGASNESVILNPSIF